jgi:hypothetical protein
MSFILCTIDKILRSEQERDVAWEKRRRENLMDIKVYFFGRPQGMSHSRPRPSMEDDMNLKSGMRKVPRFILHDLTDFFGRRYKLLGHIKDVEFIN